MNALHPTPATRTAFLRGARDVAPILVGVIPFGLIVGLSARAAGLTPLDTAASSVLVFAGASQLAAIELLGRDAPWGVAVLTVAVINMRHLMYSAALAPWLTGTPRGVRAAMSYVMTDQAFALSVARWAGQPTSRPERVAYYLGAALPLWANWQVVTVVGAVLGATLPESVPLEIAIPLVFLALLVPAVTDRPTLLAAVTGAVVAVAGTPLPANLGLIAGALTGIAAGAAADAAQRRTAETPGIGQ